MKVIWSKGAEAQIAEEGGAEAHVLSVRMHQCLEAFHDCVTANGFGGTFTNHRSDRTVPAEVVIDGETVRAWWRKRGLPGSRYIEVQRVEFDIPKKGEEA